MAWCNFENYFIYLSCTSCRTACFAQMTFLSFSLYFELYGQLFNPFHADCIVCIQWIYWWIIVFTYFSECFLLLIYRPFVKVLLMGGWDILILLVDVKVYWWTLSMSIHFCFEMGWCTSYLFYFSSLCFAVEVYSMNKDYIYTS